MRGCRTPNFRHGESWEVPSRSGRSRWVAYPASPSSRKARHRATAASCPAGGRSGTPGASSAASRRAHVSPAGAAGARTRPSGSAAGARQPCSRHTLAKGVNTSNGLHSLVRTRPGVTAFGLPVSTHATPRSASASRTQASRAAPAGSVTVETWTDAAPRAETKAGNTWAGSPWSRVRCPNQVSRSASRVAASHARRAAPAVSKNAGLRTKQTVTPPPAARSCAAAMVGRSARRRSRRSQTIALMKPA